MYFVGIDKRGYSATQLARELELSYGTAWHMVHCIRKAMKDRDMQYKLSEIIELDDSYFGAAKRAASEVGEHKKRKS